MHSAENWRRLLRSMRRILFTLLAALAVFVWQGTSWVALPFHNAALLAVKDEAAVGAVLRANLPQDGMYMLPHQSGEANTLAERYAAGPVATIGYKTVGGQMMSPEMFMRGILLDVAVAAILVILIGMTDLRGYLPRLIFVSLIGLAMGLFTNLNNWIWMSQSLQYTLVDVLDTWVAWTIGGAVLAKFSQE
jgi:hypothetical protein